MTAAALDRPRRLQFLDFVIAVAERGQYLMVMLAEIGRGFADGAVKTGHLAGLRDQIDGAKARMLDQLGVAADDRMLTSLATPLPNGIGLPPPQGIFPRYVEEAS